MDYIAKPVKFLFPPALNCIILAFTNDPEKVKNVMESFWPPHTQSVKKCAKKREDQYGKSFCSKKKFFIAIYNLMRKK